MRQAGDIYSRWFAAASLGGEYVLSERVAVVGSVAVELRRYERRFKF